MKKDRDESWIGDTSFKIYDILKNMGKCNHAVGGQIPFGEIHEWQQLRDSFEKYGTSMNKGGLAFCIRWTNMLMDSCCPIAEAIDSNPIGFTNDVVKMCAESIKKMDIIDFVEDATLIKNDISGNMKNQIFTSLKEIVVKRKTQH